MAETGETALFKPLPERLRQDQVPVGLEKESLLLAFKKKKTTIIITKCCAVLTKCAVLTVLAKCMEQVTW